MRTIVLVTTLALSLIVLAQDRCEESGALREIVDEAPTPEVSYNEISLRLNHSYDPADLGLSDGEELTFVTVINCRGQASSFEILGLKRESYRAELERLYAEVRWNPAVDAGVPVDCSFRFDFVAENGQFSIRLKQRGQLKRRRVR